MQIRAVTLTSTLVFVTVVAIGCLFPAAAYPFAGAAGVGGVNNDGKMADLFQSRYDTDVKCIPRVTGECSDTSFADDYRM